VALAKAFAFAVAMACGAIGCARDETAPPPSGPRFVLAPAVGPVEAIVRDALARATSAHRKLVVYVGAKWCEPCARVHRAVEQGELDAIFPGVTLLEFDLDRDNARLASAGYTSLYIPLFALPSADGKASRKQIAGAVKGDGAVAFVTARLRDLLAQ
jgi:hypothetical protein